MSDKAFESTNGNLANQTSKDVGRLSQIANNPANNRFVASGDQSAAPAQFFDSSTGQIAQPGQQQGTDNSTHTRGQQQFALGPTLVSFNDSTGATFVSMPDGYHQLTPEQTQQAPGQNLGAFHDDAGHRFVRTADGYHQLTPVDSAMLPQQALGQNTDLSGQVPIAPDYNRHPGQNTDLSGRPGSVAGQNTDLSGRPVSSQGDGNYPNYPPGQSGQPMNNRHRHHNQPAYDNNGQLIGQGQAPSGDGGVFGGAADGMSPGRGMYGNQDTHESSGHGLGRFLAKAGILTAELVVAETAHFNNGYGGRFGGGGRYGGFGGGYGGGNQTGNVLKFSLLNSLMRNLGGNGMGGYGMAGYGMGNPGRYYYPRQNYNYGYAPGYGAPGYGYPSY